MKMRKDKNEKRRVLLWKKSVKREHNMTTYGAGSGAAVVVGKTVEFNRRLLAAFLALVFVVTSVVIGVNIATKAQGAKDAEEYNMIETVDPETGMVLRKGYKVTDAKDPNDPYDDVFSLKLEAYATKDTTKMPLDANDTKTPLDIVMVMNQTASMTNPDVFKGVYNEIIDKNTFSVDEATGKYIKVGDDFYQVKMRQGLYAYDSDGTGPWTVNGGGDGNHYYYNSADDTYYLVKKGSGTLEYKRAAEPGVKLGGWILHDSTNWSTSAWAKKNAGNYFTYDSTKDDAYYILIREVGVLNDGYRDVFFYLPDHNPKITEKNVSTYVKGSSYDSRPNNYALDDYDSNKHKSLTIQGSNRENATTAKIYRNGPLQNGTVQSSNQSLSVPLYTHTSNTGYTHLYWDTDDSSHALGRSITIDPAVQTVYSDELFVKVNGYELYYEDDNKNPVPIWTHGVKTTTEDAYIGTLYERDNITRLASQELAANNFAEQFAKNIGDRDYRIAVVGNANAGTVYSGTKAADGAYVATETEVKDAITTLTSDATNGTALSDGLAQAADVFAANKLDPADSRKRIVIVFGDSDTWTASNVDVTRRADAVLKDTYNASVYTIGLFNNTPDETFLSQMSSEYFFSVANASTIGAYKKVDGTYHYIANGDVFPDEANSMISAFGTVVAKTSESPTTEFVLDKTTAILKDIIHENFNMPSNPKTSTNVVVATPKTFTGGTPSDWNDATKDNTITWDWDDRTLTVTNFDYDANYVSETRGAGQGQKIIITIDGLTVNQRVRTESKSAKRIYFNTTASGIYKNGAEELVINKFPRPFLDDETWLAPAGGTGTMNDKGIVVNKYLTPTENGTYDLTVEAYTTQTNSSFTEKVPTDFVIVADQSGSMSEADMPTGYKKVTGTKTLEQVASGKYYVLGDDGQYYRVYGTRNYMWRYYPANYFYVGDLIQRFSARLSWFQGPTEAGTTVTNQMFFREVKDGQTYYQPITMTVQGKVGTYYIKFGFDSVKTGQHYMFDRKNTAYSSNGISPWYKSALGNVYNSGAIYRAAHAAVSIVYDDPNAYTYSQFMGANTGMFVNYPMYDRHVGYNQLLYRDANGTEHVLSATTGQTNYEFCNDSGHALTSQTGKEPTYSGLYEATGNQTRLEALQNALTEFAEAVASEKNSNGTPVDNKIAIVGFSSNGFNNTELLTNEHYDVDFNANWISPSGSSSSEYSDNKKAHDGIQKSVADADSSNKYYKEALVSAYDASTNNKVSQKVTDGIRALTAHGGTQPEDGLNMAYKILDNREVTEYQLVSGEKKDRHTIVIYFTDGRPGNSTIENQYKEANDVVEAANPIKTKYHNLFSIGVFGESDGNPLTYKAHQESNEKVEYTYDLGWTETYHQKHSDGTEYGDFYYLNRNWRSGSPADYGATASDTIYDYMSVVSSNYPNATQYMKVKSDNTAGEADLSSENYLTMLGSVRNEYIGNNDYYRMASNQATLVAAFQQAVTMMNETISAEERLDASSVMQDMFNNANFTVQDGYSIRATTVNGTMDKYGTVNFDESSEAPATGVITKLEKVGDEQNQNQTVTVTGFDYLANYINYGYTDSETGTVIEPHDGKKLVVTISNVVPTVTGPDFYSNIFASHESSMYTNLGTVQDTDFPRPHISRHSYTLDVGDVNPNATFTVAMKVLDGNGNEVAKDANSLADIILVYPNGTRKLYSQVGAQEFLQVANGQSFYLENLPKGYQVQTEVTSTDDAYIYSIWFDKENDANSKQMTKGTPESKTFTYDDHTIHIKSKRGTKDVSVRERTIGSYGDTTHQFGEVITMEIPVITGETLVTEFPCTFNKDFSGFDDGLPKNATNYKAVFTDETPDATDTKVTKLTAITYTNSDGTPGTWNLIGGELPMRDGDVITFKNVPTGNTVKAFEPDANKFEHDVYYYYGQDDVSPSGIKLMTTNGDLLAGTHTLTFKEVDGLEKDRLEVTFENGSITKVDGVAVKAGDTIDFAKYQTMYVIDEGNDDLSDAKLNIDGTEVYFSTETEDEKTAYVATIKRETFDPPVSVTVEKNNMDILIVNERGDIEIEGIFDSNHNVIIYLLAGAGALALSAGGYYVWKKKDEFVEK